MTDLPSPTNDVMIGETMHKSYQEINLGITHKQCNFPEVQKQIQQKCYLFHII